MEPKFQTSFIPKQSLSAAPVANVRRSNRTSRAFGIGTVISIVIFIVAVSASAIVFLYQQYLSASIKSNQESLSRAREAFEPALIVQLTRLDSRINAAEELLAKHIAPSSLFALIQSITLQNVQFTQYIYTAPTETSLVHIELFGKAKSFKTLALQSDLVGTNSNLKNPVISEVALSGNGDVNFKFSADVDARMINYVEQLQSSGVNETPNNNPGGAVSTSTAI